ncbi:hypothetical protein [Desulfovibrio sp.]|nr:hypothetical protein [Desulfovibrio sp.]
MALDVRRGGAQGKSAATTHPVRGRILLSSAARALTRPDNTFTFI